MHKFLYWLIFSNFLFHCHILGLKFFYTLSFQNCLFVLSLFVIIQVSDACVKVLSIIVFFSLNCSTRCLLLDPKCIHISTFYLVIHTTYTPSTVHIWHCSGIVCYSLIVYIFLKILFFYTQHVVRDFNM